MKNKVNYLKQKSSIWMTYLLLLYLFVKATVCIFSSLHLVRVMFEIPCNNIKCNQKIKKQKNKIWKINERNKTKALLYKY